VTDSDQAEALLYNHTDRLLKGHETLLSDLNRNTSLYRALEETVTKDSVVLDIGSGTGVWAVAAAQIGARRVVAIEQEPLLIDVIKRLATNNGVAERVQVIQGDSRQIEMSREFDVVISETIGHLIFDESIVSIMIDARKRFLKPGGILIPERVALMVAGAHLEGGNQELPLGIPLAHADFQSLALNIPIGLKDRSLLRILTLPRELVHADLRDVEITPDLGKMTARWESADLKEINCFVVWAKVTLTAGIKITTTETTSWVPMIYRINPFKQDRGEIDFTLALTNKSNFWTVTVTRDGQQDAQSYSPALAATELLARTRTDAKWSRHAQRIGITDHFIDEGHTKND
jgi:SAM-dependent methyltransferase